MQDRNNRSAGSRVWAMLVACSTGQLPTRQAFRPLAKRRRPLVEAASDRTTKLSFSLSPESWKAWPALRFGAVGADLLSANSLTRLEVHACGQKFGSAQDADPDETRRLAPSCPARGPPRS